MIKIASLVLDLYDDERAELARQLPAELHECKVASRDEVDALQDRDFALVVKTAAGVRRKFPVHTLDNLKVSHAFFNMVKDTLPAEAVAVAERKFASRTELLGKKELTNDEFQVFNKVAYVDLTALKPSLVKVASADRAFGLVRDGKDMFPLHDAALVKMAAERFPSTATGLEPIERFAYARAIVKRANALGVELPDSPLHMYTSNDVNHVSLAAAIEQRKSAALKVGMDSTVLDQLAEAAGLDKATGDLEDSHSIAYRASKTASTKPMSPDRVIQILSTFDKLAGISTWHYDRGLLDPFAACFKTACGSRSLLVDDVDLSTVSPEAMAQHFDPEFIGEFTENPVQSYQALPNPMKSVIRSLAKPAGTKKPMQSDYSGITAGGNPMDALAVSYSNGRSMEF